MCEGIDRDDPRADLAGHEIGALARVLRLNEEDADTFAARLAFNTEYRDTFYNIAGLTGNPNIRWGSARLSLLWNPSSNFKAVLKVDYNYLSNGGYFGDSIINPLTGLLNPTTNLFNFSNNYHTSAIDQFVRTVLRMDYTLPGDYVLTSITANRWLRSGSFGYYGLGGDTDMVPADILNRNITPSRYENFSQEIRVTSPAGSASITTIAVARPTSPSVLRPIGLPCRSRSRPIRPPASVATPRRSTISGHSSKAIFPLQLVRLYFGSRPIM